jgi:UDP-N-acetylglucosamine--N-acetylmuramyl-(pentapeptide) pyrophosphoryl-undecaprenol N-acetylglucosamine transferase
MPTKTIAYAAGTSGGHIIPCLTLAAQEKKSAHTLFFSTDTPLDHKLIGDSNAIDTHVVLPLTTTRRFFDYPRLVWQLTHATWKSFWALRKHNVEKVVSTGGLIALPLALAAWIQNIPVELWELNAVPGEAIAWCAPLASKVVINVADAQKYFSPDKCILKPYPVQYETNQLPDARASRAHLGLDPNKKTMLILGGSQGSFFLNSAIQTMLKQHVALREDLQIIHQTGSYDTRDWEQFYKKQNINAVVFPFTNDLSCHYAATDLVICRAGSGTLHETIFFNKPFITIPLEAHTTSHQVDNARAVETMYPNLCTVILQEEIEQSTQSLYAAVIKKLEGTGHEKNNFGINHSSILPQC